jgi:CheY-like chemotaxis protein
MFHPYPPPRIRNPFRLIPPVASGAGGDGPEDATRRSGESRDAQQRVLVVEDEFLISTVLAADLQAAGYGVLGPCTTVAAAMEAVQSQSFDAAILDINLKGELVYPVAEELARRRIPFLFLSGYALVNMPERFRSYPRLAKPAEWSILLREIQSMVRPKS